MRRCRGHHKLKEHVDVVPDAACKLPVYHDGDHLDLFGNSWPVRKGFRRTLEYSRYKSREWARLDRINNPNRIRKKYPRHKETVVPKPQQTREERLAYNKAYYRAHQDELKQYRRDRYAAGKQQNDTNPNHGQ